MTVLSSEEDLDKLKDERIRSSISVLKTPKLWKWQDAKINSRANLQKGGEWAFVHADDCKLPNDCKTSCNKEGRACKLYVMKTDQGIVKVKKLCNNAKLPVRGSTGAAGYDLAAAQTAVVPAHGKVLIKTGLSISMPTGCYGRIAPRSGLALKKSIDVGAGVVDEDYRGELGVVLFDFGEDDFKINMGDKIAQLIFEKIKPLAIVEADSLEETGQGNKGFGSTGINSEDQKNISQSPDQKSDQISSVNQSSNSAQDRKCMKQFKNEPIPHMITRSQASKTRQIITTRQIQKLAKQGQPMFLAVVRPAHAVPQTRGKRGGNKKSPIYAAAAHGMTEGQKRKISKETGPKKEFITVAEREQQVLNSAPEGYRKKVETIIQQYRDIFPEKLSKGLLEDQEVQHQIKIEPGSKPPYRPPYQLGAAEQDELEEQVKDLLAQGFIRPSCSPYGAPVLFVPKKDGRWRMCIDYRALNKQTIKDHYPLPRIDLLLDRLGQARVFTKLDLAQGYHQITMAEDSIAKTAFCTHLGQWEFVVMPFGLCNAPSTFQRLMNKVFAEEINSFVLVYLDYILIYSRSIEEHWDHLQRAMEKLRQAKLYGRLYKCEFLKDKVDYLGFEVSAEGVNASPEKVKAILD